MSSTEEQKQERTQLAAINEVIKTIASSLDLRQVFDTFASQLKGLIAFDRAAVALIEGDKVKRFALSVDVESEFDSGIEIPLKDTAAEWIAANKKVYIATDLAEERRFRTDDILLREGMRSVIRIPLFSRGEVIGNFTLSSCQPNAFGKKEQGVLEEVAPLLAVAIENGRLFEQTRAREEELKASEAKHRRLAEDINDGYLVAKGGKVVFANTKMAEMLGYKLKELIGEDTIKFTPPEFIAYTEKTRQRVEQGRRVKERLEGALLNRDGERVPVEMSFKPIVYEGEPALAVIHRDITERKQAEERLRLFLAAIDNSIDGIAMGNLEGTITYVNEAFARMFGYSKEELIGKEISFVYPENEIQKLEEAVKATLEGGWTGELIGKRKDGELFPLAISSSIVMDDEGNVIAQMASHRDITERKQAEETLRASEEKFRTFMETASDLMHVADKDGNFTYVNEAMTKSLGYSKEELIGMNIRQIIHKEIVAKDFESAWEELVTKGELTLEPIWIRKDGKEIYGELKVVAVYDKDGNYVGSRAILRDITERKRAEEERQRHTRRVEALHAIAATVSQTLDLEQMLNSALEKVMEVMEADAAMIYTVDEAARDIVLAAHKGLSDEFVASIGRIRAEEEEVERMMEWKESTIALDKLYNEPNLTKIREAGAKEGVQSSVTVGLWSKGILLGSLTVACRHPRECTDEDLELLQAIANQIAVGIENARLFADVSRSAATDGLTGLYNHRYFQERLEEEVARVHRFGGECSVIMLDLDHFKIYNDLFGHVAGDEVLKRLGQILRDYTREVDIACRYGGEEFTLILPQTGPAEAYQAAERLRQAVEQALSLEGTATNTNLTVSLGVASCPGDGISREALIHSADLAMREAKERGRNQTCFASELAGAAPAEGAAAWETVEHLEAASLNTIYALAAAVDARDHYTYEHSRNVSKHAVAIGNALGLSRRKLGRLRIAALLHDIGKIGLSDSIIRKPGPLNEEEWEMMRKHSELGATIISHTPELADCAPAIRHHHEWQDGSGYPHGLKGEDIPLEARIIAVADAYDTMTTPRAYRETLSPQEALEELRRCASTQFDPQLVETFARVANSGVRAPAELSPL